MKSDDPEPVDPVAAEELWAKTRSGAIAGRGFHFQDVVGTWLAGQMLARHISATSLVPESFEDLSCEGTASWHVQAKSRQGRIGDIPVSLAADHLLKVWAAHQRRAEAGIAGRPVIVWEQPVNGDRFAGWGDSLSECLAEDHPIRTELGRKATAQGMAQRDIDELLTEVSAYVLSWDQALEQTVLVLSESTGLPGAASVAVFQALRGAVADCVDRNAASGWLDRAALDRTEIERLVVDTQQLIDRESLEFALAAGLCEPVNFADPLPAEAFFTGVDVQPGHVAAGLVVQRAELTDMILGALGTFTPTLVTGPSGAGKSAVMWVSANTASNVLWYRVRRLEGQDVEPLVRLVRAARPTLNTPVGLVVDGVGTGSINAWDRLLNELTAMPGAMLLGSARSEDLLPLRTLPRCTLVKVSLDEELAPQIHAKLVADRLTAAPHWREAFEASQGLTLEYTHLLTSGRRLGDVIGEQVNRRIAEQRWLELEVLALAATAHQWGALLSVSAIEAHLAAEPGPLRQAMQRLQDEHLIHISGGYIDGLHQLRSRALFQAIHTTPPPTPEQTVTAVVKLVEANQLPQFLTGALGATDTVLDTAVLRGLADRMPSEQSATVWTQVLNTLRLADFRRTAVGWAAILDQCGVDPADRIVTIQQVLIGGGIATDMPDLVKPEIGQAARDILALPPATSPLHGAVLDSVGAQATSKIVTGCASVHVAGLLIGAIDAWAPALTMFLDSGTVRDTPLAAAMQACPPAELGELIKTCGDLDRALAASLIDALGGQDAILTRFHDAYPWLTDVKVSVEGDQPVAYARLLHVDDEIQGNPDTYVRDLAKALVSCLPECVRADVQALLPGEITITIGDYTNGISHLLRANIYTPSSVAWARARIRASAILFQDTDLTTRVHRVTGLLADTAEFLDDLTRVWCQARGRHSDSARLTQKWTALSAAAATLTRPLDRIEEGVIDTHDGAAPAILDSAHSLVDGIVNNLPGRLISADNYSTLAAFARDTLYKAAGEVARTERWELAGMDAAPQSLARIQELLLQLHAVLAELALGQLNGKTMASCARGGPSAHALRRVAGEATTLASRRHQAQLQSVKRRAEAAHMNIDVLTRPLQDVQGVEWPPCETAITVNVSEIEEWAPQSKILATIISEELTTSGYRPPVLIVPVIGKRTVRQLAQQVTRDTWPGQELYDSWTTHVPPAWETPLAATIGQATAALRVLSGIAALRQSRQLQHQLPIIEDQSLRLDKAIERLAAEDRDEVLEVISSLRTRVLNELESETPSQDLFATQLALGGTGHPNDDYNLAIGLAFIALSEDLVQK